MHIINIEHENKPHNNYSTSYIASYIVLSFPSHAMQIVIFTRIHGQYHTLGVWGHVPPGN